MRAKIFKYVETLEIFNTIKVSADKSDTLYVIGNSVSVFGTPEILWEDICFIEDKHLIWTHGHFYNKDEYDKLNSLDEKVKSNENELKGFKDVYAATVALIMNRVTGNTEAIEEHEEKINEHEEVINEHEEELKSIKSTLFANTSIILDKINDLSLLNENELNYIKE